MRAESGFYLKSTGRRDLGGTSAGPRRDGPADIVVRLGITLWSYPQVIHSLITDFMGLTKVGDTSFFYYSRYRRLGHLDLWG